MTNKIHEHAGDNVTIRYDVQRCIHAAECTRGLPGVFDINRKPWIDPNGADADSVAKVITRCPTGALHFERKDGGPSESLPDSNTIDVGTDGPLYLRGDLEVMDAKGNVLLQDTRVALCRCGASHNKPLCDNTHEEVQFQASGELGKSTAKTVEGNDGSKLAIKATANGPLMIKGSAELVSADGQVRYQGNRMALCRCGASSNKPFCDGSHAKIGFADG